MKIETGKLLWGLDIVSKAVAVRSTLPILKHVLLNVGEGGLTLATNNLELAIACDIPVELESDEEWAITIPHRPISDYVKVLDDEKVVLERKKNKLKLSCKQQMANIWGMEKDEFPQAPVYEGQMFDLAPSIVQEMFPRTLIASAKDENRPVLATIFLNMDKRQIVAAAADGYRLSEATGNQDGEMGTQTALIPIRAAKAILHISGALPDESIRVGLNDRYAFFEVGPVRLCTAVIEGQFPDYKSMIPKEWNTQIVVPTKDLKRGVNALKNFGIVLRLEVQENGIRLSPVTIEGSSSCDIEAAVVGPELKIGLTAEYLLDVLKVVQTENVVFEMRTPTASVVVRPEGMENFTHLIMPASFS